GKGGLGRHVTSNSVKSAQVCTIKVPKNLRRPARITRARRTSGDFGERTTVAPGCRRGVWYGTERGGDETRCDVRVIRAMEGEATAGLIRTKAGGPRGEGSKVMLRRPLWQVPAWSAAALLAGWPLGAAASAEPDDPAPTAEPVTQTVKILAAKESG